VWVAERALRCTFPDVVPPAAPGFQQFYWRQSRLGYGRSRPALTRLRVKVPKRVVTPFTIDEVSRFWSSFHTSRDLAIVGLMLLQGLRSCEVLALDQEDLILSEAQIRVRGKGNKVRLLPLAPEAVQLLEHYLRLERPSHCGMALFVCLKGRARGTRMTAAGLRSLFRHHRQTTGVAKANPHRFRHTFATDLIRAGISLPALMQLMGHAQIQTTMVYVSITPQDVYQQYVRAVAQLVRHVPPSHS
jgi:integrase/recombinase XerD